MSGKPPLRLIWEGEWNDIVCADYPLAPKRYVEEVFHPLLNTHADCLLYNLCSSDAYCCELEQGEPLMGGVDKFDDAWVWRSPASRDPPGQSAARVPENDRPGLQRLGRASAALNQNARRVRINTISS